MGLLHRRREPSVAAHSELDVLRAELDRIRVERDRAADALDSLPIGIVLVGPDGAEVMRNAAARHGGGSGHGDVLLEEAIERHVQIARSGRESRAAVELFGPPKRVLVVDAAPLRDGGALVWIEDVSERSRLDAVRTDFVANISHELKTPVGALAVLAEAVADEDDVEVTQRLAAKLVSEAHRAATVIDDLLELSRIELGGRAVREPVDVTTVLRDAVVRSLASAEQRNIRIDLDEPQPPLTMLGDRRQLVSAVSNLIDNAVKYSEHGSEVWVSAEVPADDAAYVSLVVQDHGIGIPARDLGRIFERFYRVDRARSRDTGGTGLGLAIVRHVATNHEGDVQVTSSEGEGSTFTLRIPVAA